MSREDTVISMLSDIKEDVGKLTAFNEANYQRIERHEKIHEKQDKAIEELEHAAQRRKGEMTVIKSVIGALAGLLGWHVGLSK